MIYALHHLEYRSLVALSLLLNYLDLRIPFLRTPTARLMLLLRGFDNGLEMLERRAVDLCSTYASNRSWRQEKASSAAAAASV